MDIKDFNVLIENKPFFDLHVKYKRRMKILSEFQEIRIIQQETC